MGRGGADAARPLAADLRDVDVNVRAQAARSLRALNARQAVPDLVAALDDPQPGVREAAAAALAPLQDPAAVDPLILLLQDPAPIVRQTAANSVLALLPTPLGQALHALVNGETPSQQVQAAETLGELLDPRAIPALRRALHEDRPVCQSAARALVRFGAERVLGVLQQVLADPSPGVRALAAQALGELGDGRAEGILLPVLVDASAEVRRAVAEALSSVSPPSSRALAEAVRAFVVGEPPQRREAVRRLAGLGDQRAVPLLRQALFNDSDLQVRVETARVLPLLGVQALPLLTQALGGAAAAGAREVLSVLGSEALDAIAEAAGRGSGDVQKAAIGLLGESEDERALETLVALLATLRDAPQQAVLDALRGRAQDPRVVQALIDTLRVPDTWVRLKAVRLLGESGSSLAVAPLVRALEDHGLRTAAAEALKRLGDQATAALLERYQEEKDRDLRHLIGELLGEKKPGMRDRLFGRKRA